MESLGNHLLLELWGVAGALLDDAAALEERLIGAADRGGVHVVEGRFRRFEPQGISGVIILAESHITIHTWPELGYAAVDVFTCGPPQLGEAVSTEILRAFAPLRHEVQRVRRGVLGPQQIAGGGSR